MSNLIRQNPFLKNKAIRSFRFNAFFEVSIHAKTYSEQLVETRPLESALIIHILSALPSTTSTRDSVFSQAEIITH